LELELGALIFVVYRFVFDVNRARSQKSAVLYPEPEDCVLSDLVGVDVYGLSVVLDEGERL
jgi:hypothetical protein